VRIINDDRLRTSSPQRIRESFGIVVHREQSDAIADQNFVKVRLAGSWLTNQQQVASSAPKPLQILLAAHEGWSFGAGSRGQCG
jgi:hypothetical protein